MNSLVTATPPKVTRSIPRRSPQRQTPLQPLEIINVPGALLRLETLARVSGRSVNTLYRDASEARGLLVLSRFGTHCTRVTSENARAYLARLAGGAA